MQLLDPKGLANGELASLQEKLTAALTLMARSPEKGGHPFILAFSASKTHSLADVKIPIYTDADGTEQYAYTCATNGKEYFWHPEMLKRMKPREIVHLMCHETYHVVLQHCDYDRCLGKNRKIWNIAVDYVVNAMIEHDYRQSKKTYHNYDNNNHHPIWSGGLGKGLPYDHLIESIKKLHSEVKGAKNRQAPKKVKHKKTPPQRKGPVNPDDLCMYADYSQYGKSAETIYNDIMQYVKDIEEDMLDMKLQELGASQMDDHPIVQISRNRLLQEILDAATTAKKMAGSVPAAVEDQLLKLQDPKLSWQDLVRNTIQTKRQEKGNINDWSRVRRRSVSMNIQPNIPNALPYYIPKKKSDYVTWLALLDTSGSMSQEDMTFGVSQLQCLDSRSDGLVVCCDAETYWDKATRIRNMKDLPTVKLVGRGGTVFESFFEDYRKKVGDAWDLIIIMTDGCIFDLPKLRRPHCDVVWILTGNYGDFQPPFGRAVPFRAF